MKTFSVRQNHYHLSVFKRKSFRVFLFPKKKSVGKTVPPMLHLSWFRAHWYSHNRHQSWLLTWFLSCVKIPSTKKKVGVPDCIRNFIHYNPTKNEILGSEKRETKNASIKSCQQWIYVFGYVCIQQIRKSSYYVCKWCRNLADTRKRFEQRLFANPKKTHQSTEDFLQFFKHLFLLHFFLGLCKILP